MECGTGQVLGFTTEALNFIVGLWDKVRIKVKVNNIEECREELLQMGLPRSTQKLLTILLVNIEINHFITYNNKFIVLLIFFSSQLMFL
jgi:hypothetical protein